MSERKFKTIEAVIRRGVTKGMLIGVTASRIPMAEFECDKIMPCIQFLTNPRIVYDHTIEESCKIVNRLVEAYLELQFAFAINRYNLKEGEVWKAFPRKRNGEYAAPVILNAGNKSIHIIGMIKVHLDKLDEFVAMLRALDCVDEKYLDMVLLKREFTLRLSGKDKYGLRPVMPIVIGEVVEANTNRWVVDAKVHPRAFLLADRWLYTFRRHGFDLMIRYLRV
jgi:hypothetical protein